MFVGRDFSHDLISAKISPALQVAEKSLATEKATVSGDAK
jgi:hypothetical protein